MNKLDLKKTLFLSLILITVTPLPAFANVGVPMIFLTFPAMLTALLPIILIESVVIKKALNIPMKKALMSNGTANLVSTIGGFPLAWGLLFGLELLTTRGSCGPGFKTISSSIITAILESAWLCPWKEHMYWLIPVAFINCLIAAFFLSILIEYFIMRKMLKEYDKNAVKKVTYKANIVSYSMLVIFNIGYLIYNIAEKA